MQFCIFNLIRFIFSQQYAFEEYRGKEDTAEELTCDGIKYTSICVNTLKLFTKCTKLTISCTSLIKIPSGLENITFLKDFTYSSNRNIGNIDSLRCVTSLEKLNLQKNNLKTVPECIYKLPNLTCLKLNNNYITTIPSAIVTLKKLRELHIANNFITILPDSIGKLKKLEFADFSFNQIETLPVQLGKLENMQRLYLNNNKIEILPVELFNQEKLVSLILSNNKIHEIPNNIGNLSNLKHLYIAFNNIQFLPNELGLLSKLVYLNLGSNDIESLPNEICQLSSLKTADFSNNHIEILPYELSQLQSLKSLNISHNKIKFLSDSLANLTNLVTLKASNNYITSISTNINQLKNLEGVDISFNKLTSLPSQMNLLTKLDTFNASYNLLKTFPHDFLLPANLTKLDISNNSLSSFPTFENTHKLTFILFSHNKIKELPDEIGNFTNLYAFDASFNLLEKLPQCFGSLSNLHHLNLNNNKLKQLTSSFSTLKKLSYLHLQNNLFTKIPAQIYELQQLNTIMLGGNGIASLLRGNASVFSNARSTMGIGKKNLFMLEHISVVNFDNNSIEEIPEDIKRLKNLRSLSLNNNNIGTIPSCIKDLRKIKTLSLDNNKITDIPSEIKHLVNLETLSLNNNLIKTVSAITIHSLVSLKVLRLASNELQVLPYNLRSLLQNKLTDLFVQENFISLSSSNGLGTLDLRKFRLKEFQIYPQYLPNGTLSDVISKIENAGIYWNMAKLTEINNPDEILSFPQRMSDKQMRRIWRLLLKYFIDVPLQDSVVSYQVATTFDSCDEAVEDSESSVEMDNETEPMLLKILNSNTVSTIKNNTYENYTNLSYNKDIKENHLLRKKTSTFLREISTDKLDFALKTVIVDTVDGLSTIDSVVKVPEANGLIKSYIKAIFYKMLCYIADDDVASEGLNQIKLTILDLSQYVLLNRASKQLEGLAFYYSMYSQATPATTTNLLIDQINFIIATIKEVSFIKATNGDITSQIHDISNWRGVFKDILGISPSLNDEKAKTFVPVTSELKKGSVLMAFSNLFTIDKVAEALLIKINSNGQLFTMAYKLLSDICKVKMREEEPFIYKRLINTYFIYELKPGNVKHTPKELKKEGVIRILIHLQILKDSPIVLS